MRNAKTTVLLDLRHDFHQKLCSEILGLRPGTDCYSIADSSSESSKDLAAKMVSRMGCEICSSPKTGQTAGSLFTHFTLQFVEASFARIQHIRPGTWRYSMSQSSTGIAAFDQYEHLADLQKVLQAHRDLAAALGGDYLVSPDIVVSREPLSDEEINSQESIVGADAHAARLTPLRAGNRTNPLGILHASISCKWTMRSDRAQNTRTEALNLIRNRKGKTPHIVAVTLEPLPTRLASIAMGTGDVDCTYHAALYELVEATAASGRQDQDEMLRTLVDGRRLRDISDLPFDLAC
jgi:hypothetical protein